MLGNAKGDMKILVADDSRSSRLILAAVLKKWGYQPIVVDDGNAAWEVLLGPDAPRLAILDWIMPGLTGLQICSRVRRLNISEPPYIIILTSRGETHDIVSGLEAGANDYIAKPFDNAELRARIKVGQRMVEMQAEMNKAKNALIYEAHHDPLTSTLNRRAILNVLEKELVRAARESTQISIGLVDIDHFKRVNDTFGHQVGDEVLCSFAGIIEENIRLYDHLGRYGGEEFLLITPHRNDQAEAGLYERLCEVVSDSQLQTKAGTIAITVSVGVARATAGSTIDSILDAADKALYQAKEDGRNRVVHAR